MQLTAKLSGAECNADVILKLSALEGPAKALKIGSLTLNVDAKQTDSAVKVALGTPIATHSAPEARRAAEDRRGSESRQSDAPTEGDEGVAIRRPPCRSGERAPCRGPHRQAG
ncbi:MAG TPA: hypothetical protein VMH32_04485 [Burkholderiales bacterium]|nr:hypothetical protein [Burkholderiales bacterium]